MGFKPSTSDPVVWLRKVTKPDNERYYEYVLVYVDDILTISYKAQEVIDNIHALFKFKGDEVEVPSTYLDTGLKFRQLDGVGCCTMSSNAYVQVAVKKVQEKLTKSS